MAATNPWAKRAARAPRYEKMKPDPFARFAKAPNALAKLDSFRTKLREQGQLSSAGLIPASRRSELIAELAEFEESPDLYDLKNEDSIRSYKKRASESSRLTRDELISLVDHSIDKVMYGPSEKGEPPIAQKDASDIREEYLNDVARVYESRSDDTPFIPFLVNITWSFVSEKMEGRRRSPAVDYSVEGVFYAVTEEEAVAAGQQFILNYIRPAVSGGGDKVIDLAAQGPDGDARATTIGAEAIEGAALTKSQVKELAFDPQLRAFFTSSSGKVSVDQNFRDPGYRYRIVKGSFETI